MTIYAGDVKLVASQVMDDASNGGGAPSAIIITDGASNAVFPDISELDRAGGRVNLRKVFVNVQTDNTDSYLGSNLIVAEPPSDPLVSVTAFSTGDVFDRRSSASSRIESYLVASAKWGGGYLYESHVQGQRVIQLFQRPGAATPTVGRTLKLVANEGLSNEYSQYIRVTKVTTVAQTFSYSIGNGIANYDATIVSLEISDSLKYDFPGSSANPTFTASGSGTVTRDTVVADAATYYGSSRLTTTCSIGDVTAHVSSVFSQIVPNAQTEIPMVDKSVAENTSVLLPANNGEVSFFLDQGNLAGAKVYVPTAVKPGSMYINGAYDNGGGGWDTMLHTIDYEKGEITLGQMVGNINLRYTPAVVNKQLADTYSIAVTIENRSYSYIITLTDDISPKTLSVSYRASGNWYTLTDVGLGKIKGSAAEYGGGTINYGTGTISITLGAMPDVGSAIIYSWGRTVDAIDRSADSIQVGTTTFNLNTTDIVPGTLGFTLSGYGAVTDSSGRIMTTGGTPVQVGTVDYKSGIVSITNTQTSSATTITSVQYYNGTQLTHSVTNPGLSSGAMTIDLNGSVAPNSVVVQWSRTLLEYPSQDLSDNTYRAPDFVAPYPRAAARDDGNGNLKYNGNTVGSVNYTTGVISLTPGYTQSAPYPRYANVTVLGDPTSKYSRAGWRFGTATWGLDTTQPVEVTYLGNTSGTSVSGVSVTAASSGIKLTSVAGERILPGSVVLQTGTDIYGRAQYVFDKNGSIYGSFGLYTGSSTQIGSIDYATGIVTLNYSGVATPIPVTAVKSMMTVRDYDVVSNVTFRIPVSPVRPGSLQIVANRTNGSQITGTSDNNGVISGTWMRGKIDYAMGVATVQFGQMVTAAGNEAADWYDASQVVGGQIFKPELVIPSSVKYNAVSYTYLPLDASILGLDPVRLPADGKVPVFRRGGFVVVGNTGSVTATVSNGQTIDCARVRLSRVRVIGHDGAVITTGYTADLDAGTVTFNNVTGYSQPVTVEHRIEDMVQVSDLDISGVLKFTRALTHDFPVGSTVSSALVAGDIKSRVSLLFDQATWNGTSWLDVVSGNPATATYNDIGYPLALTNKGSTTERWALQFTNTTTFNIIGEHVGQIGTGTTGADCAPINPATGVPYFTISAGGWGSGWAAGNILRFNTIGALFPAWIIRTIQQGQGTVSNDSFTLLSRGDIDTP